MLLPAFYYGNPPAPAAQMNIWKFLVGYSIALSNLLTSP